MPNESKVVIKVNDKHVRLLKLHSVIMLMTNLLLLLYIHDKQFKTK